MLILYSLNLPLDTDSLTYCLSTSQMICGLGILDEFECRNRGLVVFRGRLLSPRTRAPLKRTFNVNLPDVIESGKVPRGTFSYPTKTPTIVSQSDLDKIPATHYRLYRNGASTEVSYG